MNALNPLASDKRGDERKAYEPSMEEILASIRRIIADDQAFAARSTPAPHMRPVPQAAPVPSRPIMSEPPLRRDILRGPSANDQSAEETRPAAALGLRPTALAEVQEPAPAPATFPVEAQFQTFKTATLPVAAEPSFEPPRSAGTPNLRLAAVEESETLAFSPLPDADEAETIESAVESFEAEASEPPLVSAETNAKVASAFNTLIASRFVESDGALNDALKEMIRPMLKAWLDDNLPVLVERLVRAEIERVARGSR